MIEKFFDIVERNRDKRAEYYIKQDGKTPVFRYEVLRGNRIKDIYRLYKSYQGCKEFLYVPGKEEIEDVFSSNNKDYVGMIDKSNDNKLVGAVKIEHLHFPYPFFEVPKSEKAYQDHYYGISGLLVDSLYRQHGLGKRLVNESLENLHFLGAKGVYADCDFRNIASFSTLSRYMDMVGFVDGRNGAEGEKSFYTTFCHVYDLADNKKVQKAGLDFSNALDYDCVAEVYQNNLQKLGDFSCHKRDYQDGYNEVYVLDNPVRILNMRLEVGAHWEQTLDNGTAKDGILPPFWLFNSMRGNFK